MGKGFVMFAPRPRASRLLPAALLGIACLPASLSFAHADASVSLRYRFTAGRVLTYRVTMHAENRVLIPGKPADISTDTDTFLARYTFRHIDRGGAATLTISIADPRRTVDHNGAITHSTPAPASITTPTDACIQEADGTQFCSYRGAYGENDIGQLVDGPVSVGASWTSRIDNTWDVSARTPVMITNTLGQLASTPGGRVATINSVGHVSGPSKHTGGGKTATSVLHGTIGGSWQFAIESGTFLSEHLLETGSSTGRVQDAHGSHPITNQFSTTTTMQLVSQATVVPRPFGPSGPTQSYTSATWGYSAAYPRSWQGATKAPFNFQAVTADGNAGFFVYSEASSPVVDGPFVQRFVRLFGTPEGEPTIYIHTAGGQQSVSGDALIETKDHLEMQCEVRVTDTSHGLLVFLGLASSGKADGSVRLPAFARQWEQVQQVLDSITIS